MAGFRANRCNFNDDQLKFNIKTVSEENGIAEDKAQISDSKNLCVEMETGTGKTLVYLKTIYELYKHYGFTKFIILVPSVAIRQGVLFVAQYLWKSASRNLRIQAGLF